MQIPILRIPYSESDVSFIKNGVEEILNSGNLTMGKYTQDFEKLFSSFADVKYCIAVSNATAGLEIIIRALGIEGQSIIVPTNTFLATALAVTHSGNKVIFADSDPDTFSLDVDDVKNRITEDTRAIIVVHIGGIITPQTYNLQEFCKEKGLYLIEDCAHAHGCSIDNKQAGSLGIAGAFSFFPTKVLTTGEGGIITTNNEDLFKKALMLRNHGKNPGMGNKISEAGHNQRLSEITALLGVEQMRRARQIIKERRKAAKYYDESLSNLSGIRLLTIPNNIYSSYYKYIVYLDKQYERSQVKQVMKDKYGVSLTGEVYADLCHTEPIWESYTYCGKQKNGDSVSCHRWPGCECNEPQNDFPGAEYLSKHHICLPLYSDLKKEELEYVVKSLKNTLLELGGN